uniref:SERPIN domain-containing protein n=1 Tax=Steinernema glaseri TaxID=37863 RepID=A0A1I7Y362_9BILA
MAKSAPIKGPTQAPSRVLPPVPTKSQRSSAKIPDSPTPPAAASPTPVPKKSPVPKKAAAPAVVRTASAEQPSVVWELPNLLDVGLDIIRSVPSKKVNASVIPVTELKKYRKTFEETNICVSPLEVLRGFGALLLMAESHTHAELLHCLRRCLYGSKGGKMTADQIHQHLFSVGREYVFNLTSAAVRIFFEKRSVLPFDAQVTATIDAFYKEPNVFPDAPELKAKENVLRETNFMTSPNGDAMRIRINKAMKIASNGRVEHVVRRDLAPTWRARHVLASCLDGNFHWKISGIGEPRSTYFYDAYDRSIEKRSTVVAVKAECSIRTVICKNRVRVVELDSHDENMKLYVLQPQTAHLSSIELAYMSGEMLRAYIDACSKQPVIKTTVMMPHMSMTNSVGVRQAFNKPRKGMLSKLFKGNGPKNSIPPISRVFHPYDCELARGIAGDKEFGVTYSFPLYEHYHKTKFNILMCHRPPLDPEEIRPLVNPPECKPVPANVLENIQLSTINARLNLARANVHQSDKLREAVEALEKELNDIEKKAKPSEKEESVWKPLGKKESENVKLASKPAPLEVMLKSTKQETKYKIAPQSSRQEAGAEPNNNAPSQFIPMKNTPSKIGKGNNAPSKFIPVNNAPS